MTFKRVAVSATVALLSLFALIVPAQAASAVPLLPPPANCRYNGSLCGYESAFYNCDDGCEVIPFASTSTCEPVALSRQWSSLWNNSGRTARVYKSTNCTGTYLTYYSGTGEYYFVTGGNSDWENQVRSMRFV